MTAPINGNTKCLICNEDFRYTAMLGNGNLLHTNVQTVLAESAIAVGKLGMTNDGPKVDVEIIVECPHCKIKNKVLNNIKSM